MLLELAGVAGALLSAAADVNSQEEQTAREQIRLQAEREQRENDAAARRHETTMAILGGLFSLMETAISNPGTYLEDSQK